MVFQKWMLVLIPIWIPLYLAACYTSLTQPEAAIATESPTPVFTPPATTTSPDTPTPASPPNQSPVTAAPLELVGHIGGSTLAVTGQGDYLYLGNGTELAILDVSDSTRPRRVGYVVLPDVVIDIYVTSDIVYAKVDQHGFHIIDISNPAAPVDLGPVDVPQATGPMVVNGKVGYFATEALGLTVFDLSHPMAPTELFFLALGQNAEPVTLVDDNLYVADNKRLMIVDVSDPIHLVEVGSYNLPGPVQDIAVVGHIAYVADTAALRVFDISNPTNPTEISFYATSYYMDIIYHNPGVGPGCETTSLVVEGSYAYINGCDGDQIIDISNPARPTRAGSLDDVPGSMVIAMNGYGYMLDLDGLYILDLADAVTPQVVGTYRTPPLIDRDFVVAGSYIYVADAYSGLHIVDVSNPAAPVEVGFYQPSALDAGLMVAVQSNYAYVVDRKALRIIDVSNPEIPVEVGAVDVPQQNDTVVHQTFGGVAVAGDYAYAASLFGNPMMWIVDISDPAAPVEISFSYRLPPGAQDIVVVDDYAYIITGNSSLEIVDVSDPATPVQIGIYMSEAGILWSDLAVVGNYAYLGAWHPHDLRVIDISDPTAPVEVGNYTPAGDGRAVAVASSLAYVMDEYRGVLKVVDISDPAKPAKVAFYDLPNPTHFGDVAVADGYVYVDIGAAGLYIYAEKTETVESGPEEKAKPQFNLPLQPCPVTLPPAQPFIPPDPYPAQPPGDLFWYGDELLWTALPPDGVWDYLPHNPTGYTQKLLWWRVGYSWTEEPKPALHVTGYRLDDPTISFPASPATNAYAPDIQSAMLVGVDFSTPGCWKITGRYADAELSYIVQIEP